MTMTTGNATENNAESSAYRWAILSAATAAQACSSFAMQGLGALSGFLQQAFDLSGASVGLLITVSGLAPIGALLVVGHLLDRHGERVVVMLGAVVAAMGLGVSGLADQYGVVLVGLFVLGIGYSTVQPGGSKAVAMWFSGRRGMAMGIRQSGLPLGGACAALALPMVAQSFGWRAAFWICAAVVLGGGGVFALVYRRAQVGTGNTTSALLPALAQRLRDPAMRNIFISGISLITAQFGVTTYLMLFLRDHDGISLARGAMVLFALQAAGILGRIVLAALSDRPGRTRLAWVRLCMVCSAAVLAALPMIPGTIPIAAIAVIAACLGFFVLGWYGPWVAHVSEISPAGAVGLALGASMAANQVAIVVSPPLLGLLRDVTAGYAAVWWTLAGLLLIAVAFSSSAWSRGGAAGTR